MRERAYGNLHGEGGKRRKDAMEAHGLLLLHCACPLGPPYMWAVTIYESKSE